MGQCILSIKIVYFHKYNNYIYSTYRNILYQFLYTVITVLVSIQATFSHDHNNVLQNDVLVFNNKSATSSSHRTLLVYWQ